MEFNVRHLLYAIIGGVIVTLLTGLVLNTPYGWGGGALYGLPFPWLTVSLPAPPYSPQYSFNLLAMIADIIVWTGGSEIILMLLPRLKEDFELD